jgi:hypothetical protein
LSAGLTPGLFAVWCCVVYEQIMATDGLWEFVSDQEAIDLAASKKDPQQAVEALIREANDRWMREEQVGGGRGRQRASQTIGVLTRLCCAVLR